MFVPMSALKIFSGTFLDCIHRAMDASVQIHFAFRKKTFAFDFDIYSIFHIIGFFNCIVFLSFLFLMPFVIESHPFHFYYFIFFLERKKITFVYI